MKFLVVNAIQKVYCNVVLRQYDLSITFHQVETIEASNFAEPELTLQPQK